MTDEQGGDEKIIAVPSDKVSPIYRKVQDWTDLPDMLIQRVAHFFEHYKDLESGKWVKIARWGDAAEARETINRAMEAAGGK
jgi:inorganic pyrophosphatase